jgi:histidinol-phosphate aminotransferase
MEYQISKEIKDDKYEECIKLDLNEFDFDHHIDIYKYIQKSVIKPKSITHYSNQFNNSTKELIQKISKYNNIKENQVMLSAGSDDSLEYIINRYIYFNTHVIVFVPSYSYFEIIIKRRTNNIHYIPLDFNKSQYKIEECLEFYKDILEKAVVYIVNPNNPLGVLCCKKSLENVIKLYTNTLFVIDEAYIEFSAKETCVNLINSYKNIIITRTFSKAYGLAGMRLGYLLANEETVKYVKVIYNEKNTTDLSKSAGIAIYDNINYYEDIILNAVNIRNDFQDFLQEYNIYYVKSNSNFISFYIGNKSEEFLNILESKHIFIRNRNTQIDMYGFVRVTIGKIENMILLKNIIIENINLFEIDIGPINKHYTDKQTIWKLKLLFKKFIDIINNNNKKTITPLTYWLDGGTLLGIYRNNGIISYDDDIDIGINEHDINLLLELKNNFEKEGLRLKLNRTKCYYQIDFISDIIDDNLTNDLHIDIFPFKNENGILKNIDQRFILNDAIKCNFVYNECDLFPLKPYSFYGLLNVYIPNNVEKILKENILSDFKNVACFEENGKIYNYKIIRPFFA